MTGPKNDNPGSRGGASGEMRQRRVTLVIAVAGSMAFIVALWVFVLPNQLSGEWENSGSGLAAWTMLRTGENVKEVQDVWRTSTAEISRMIDDLKFEFAPEPETPISAEALQSLKAKIEAAASAEAAPEKK